MNERIEAHWRTRFDEAARVQEDDHAIAIWSREGLDAQQSLFFQVFRETVHHPQRILDLGCGPGVYARALAAEGHQVCGLDYTLAVLPKAKARAQAAGHPIWVLGGEAYRLPYRDAVFESVICSGVFQHLSDEGQALREILRVLKPGGALFLMTRNVLFTPNRRSDRTGHMRSFHPFALRRQMMGYGYTNGRIDGIFILRGRTRWLRPILRRFHHLNAFTRPLILAAEAFLLRAEKPPERRR